jgi:hypothetical protein
VHCFEGNKAETRTLIPVLQAFQERHGLHDVVVVADAGMLSAANLNALDDAGFSFIVGSRISEAPYGRCQVVCLRREVLLVRVEVRDLCLLPVAAGGWS